MTIIRDEGEHPHRSKPTS